MPRIRVATFNCENLFARFKFKAGIDADAAKRDGWEVNGTAFQPFDPISRRITAEAMQACRADVICLQEVENLDALKRFRSQFLGGHDTYRYVACMDGNDPRLIDVAVMSRLPITHLRSYQHLRVDSSYLFSRDCLELDVVSDKVRLTLFINHLKSMIGGRKATAERRRLQAREVKRIVRERFGRDPGDVPFVVLGDFNDYLGTDRTGSSGVSALVEWDEVENVVARLPEEERWTHYYAGGQEYRQLDYLLPSASLAAASGGVPEIVRNGMPLRADRYSGPRFEGVGRDEPKASDHCPVVMELSL